jgi:hypothetical protein
MDFYFPGAGIFLLGSVYFGLRNHWPKEVRQKIASLEKEAVPISLEAVEEQLYPAIAVSNRPDRPFRRALVMERAQGLSLILGTNRALTDFLQEASIEEDEERESRPAESRAVWWGIEMNAGQRPSPSGLPVFSRIF